MSDTRQQNGRGYDRHLIWHPRGNIVLTWATLITLLYAVWQASEGFTEVKGELKALKEVTDVRIGALDDRLDELRDRVNRSIASDVRSRQNRATYNVFPLGDVDE